MALSDAEPVIVRVVLLRVPLRPVPRPVDAEKTAVTRLIDPENPSLLVAVMVDVAVPPAVM